MIGKIHRHGIANHLITHIHIGIDKLEIIRECLDPSYFSYRHTAIEMLLARHKLLQILLII